jgi:hypothetical protein
MAGDDERLSPRQVSLVLKRAAELERRDVGDESLAPAELEELAREVGLSPESVQRALAEVRAGAVAEPREPGALERVLGPNMIVVERTVRGRAGEVQRRVERALRGQLLRKRRDFGERTVWEHAPGWLPALRRALDWSGELALGEARELDVTVVDAGEDRATVRFVVDVGALQRKVAAGTALGTAAGIAAAVTLWAMHTPVVLEWLAAAGATATGSITSVRAYRRQLASTETALEHLLDDVERPPTPHSPLDALFAR